jgi:NTE family protein
MKRGTYDHKILLLQGGGALGSYHCGVYQGLAEIGAMPNWFVGISIGAINSAILAGNPPERRLERLRTFWEMATSPFTFEPPAWLEPLRPMLHRIGFAQVCTWGVPGFFKPRSILPDFALSGSPDALSYYDTAPLRQTLEQLVDFDLINRGDVRLSLGAVNVRTAESVYFDNHKTRITPYHVMASGALPPGFPAIQIDGEYYYDGGLVSNTPLTYVMDEKPLDTAVMVQVNLFNAHGRLPRTLDEAMERVKDIQFSSKQRFNTRRIKELMELRMALIRLMAKLPPELKTDPDVAKLESLCDNRDWTIVHVNNHRIQHAGQNKDADFSRLGVLDRWAAGLEDIRISAANLEWLQPMELGGGLRIYHMPPQSPTVSVGVGAAAAEVEKDFKGNGTTMRNRLVPVEIA